jgi:hypothetical protein
MPNWLIFLVGEPISSNGFTFKTSIFSMFDISSSLYNKASKTFLACSQYLPAEAIKPMALVLSTHILQ